eukprot:g3459.t1
MATLQEKLNGTHAETLSNLHAEIATLKQELSLKSENAELKIVEQKLATALRKNAEVVAELDLSEKKTLKLVADMEEASELARKLEIAENARRAQQELDAAVLATKDELTAKNAESLDAVMERAKVEQAQAVSDAVLQAEAAAATRAEEVRQIHEKQLVCAVSEAVAAAKRDHDEDLQKTEHRAMQDKAEAIAKAKSTQKEKTTRLLEEKHRSILDSSLRELEKFSSDSKVAALKQQSDLHTKEITSLKMIHAKSVEDMTISHEKSVKDAAEKCRETVTKEYQKMLEEQAAVHDQKMREMSEEHSALLKEKQQAYTELEQNMATSLEAVQSEAQSEIEQHKAESAAEMKSHQADFSNEINKVESAKKEYQKMLEEQAAVHDQKMREMSEEHSALLKEKQQAYTELEQNMATSLEAVQSEAQSEIEQHKAESAAEMKSHQADFSNEINKVESAKKEYQKMLEEQAAVHDQKMREMSEEHSALLKEKQQAYTELEQNMATSLEAVQSKAQFEIEQNDKVHADKIEVYENMMNLRQAAICAKDFAIDKAKRFHMSEISELRERNSEFMEQTRAAYTIQKWYHKRQMYLQNKNMMKATVFQAITEARTHSQVMLEVERSRVNSLKSQYEHQFAKAEKAFEQEKKDILQEGEAARESEILSLQKLNNQEKELLRNHMEENQTKMKMEAETLELSLRAEISEHRNNIQSLKQDLEATSIRHASQLKLMVTEDRHQKLLEDALGRERSVLAASLAEVEEANKAKVEELEINKELELRVTKSQFELKQASTLRSLNRHLEILETTRDQLLEREKQISTLNEQKNGLLTEVEAHALKLKNVNALLKTRERHYASSLAAATIQRMYRRSKMIQESRNFGKEITKFMTAGKLRAATAEESHALEIAKLKNQLEEQREKAKIHHNSMEAKHTSVKNERERALSEVESMTTQLISARKSFTAQNNALKAELESATMKVKVESLTHAELMTELETKHSSSMAAATEKIESISSALKSTEASHEEKVKNLKAAKIALQEEAHAKICELRKTHEQEIDRLHDYGVEREKIAKETAQKSQAEAVASALQSALAEARLAHQVSMEEALSVAHAEKESEIRKIRELDERKLESELARMKIEHEEILNDNKKKMLEIKNEHQKVLKRTESDAQVLRMQMVSSAAQSRESYSKLEARWKSSEADLYAQSQTAKLALLTSKREAVEEAEKLRSIGRSEMSDLREVDKLSRLLSITKLDGQKDADRARMEIENLTQQAKESALLSSQRLEHSMELATKREEEHAEILRKTSENHMRSLEEQSTRLNSVHEKTIQTLRKTFEEDSKIAVKNALESACEKHESELKEALSAANIVKAEALEELSSVAQREMTQLKSEMNDIKSKILIQAAEHEEALKAVETIHAADLLKKDKAHAKIVNIKVQQALKEAEEEAMRSNDKISTKIKMLEDELEGMRAMHREDLEKERQKMQSIQDRANKRAEKVVEDKLREMEAARKETDKQSASARKSAAAAKEAQKALDKELKKQQQISQSLTTVALRKRLRNLSQEHVKAQVLLKQHEADKAEAVADAIQMGEKARRETMEKRYARKLDQAITEEQQRLAKTHSRDIEELQAAHKKALAAKMRSINAIELRLQKKNDALDKMRVDHKKREQESSKREGKDFAKIQQAKAENEKLHLKVLDCVLEDDQLSRNPSWDTPGSEETYVNRIKAILSDRDRAREELKKAVEAHAQLEEAHAKTKRKMQEEAAKHISEEARAFQNQILAMEEAAAETKESHETEMLTIREKYKANNLAVVDELHRMEAEHKEVLSNLREEWEKEKSIEKVVYETDSRKLLSLEHNLQMSKHEAAALREQVKALQRNLKEEKSLSRKLNHERQSARFEGCETEQKLNKLVESKSSAVTLRNKMQSGMMSEDRNATKRIGKTKVSARKNKGVKVAVSVLDQVDDRSSYNQHLQNQFLNSYREWKI